MTTYKCPVCDWVLEYKEIGRQIFDHEQEHEKEKRLREEQYNDI